MRGVGGGGGDEGVGGEEGLKELLEVEERQIERGGGRVHCGTLGV